MVKKSGKVHEEVSKLLQDKGVDTRTLEVATFSRGSDHVIILNGEPVGEYNHKSRRLFTYGNE